MTEQEHDDMVEAGDEFWLAFSSLCKEYLDRAPAHLREHYKMYLGEKTSIYGIKRGDL